MDRNPHTGPSARSCRECCRGAKRLAESTQTPEGGEECKDLGGRYLAYASEGSAAALAHTRGEVYNDTSLQRTWQSLPPLDRAVLQLIARGITAVFSATIRGQLGKGMGEPAPSICVVQKVLGRLTRSEILVRVERGEYHVQDDVLLQWLKRSN
jgi:hypothetical protein